MITPHQTWGTSNIANMEELKTKITKEDKEETRITLIQIYIWGKTLQEVPKKEQKEQRRTHLSLYLWRNHL